MNDDSTEISSEMAIKMYLFELDKWFNIKTISKIQRLMPMKASVKYLTAKLWFRHAILTESNHIE